MGGGSLHTANRAIKDGATERQTPRRGREIGYATLQHNTAVRIDIGIGGGIGGGGIGP